MKVALVGCGRMGLRHLKVFSNLNLEIVGIVDPQKTALEQAIQEFQLSSNIGFTSLELLLEKIIPECVVIATTAPYHADYVKQCAEKGVQYILCEKPISISLASALDMIEICEKHQTKLAINHQMRFMEQYTEIKKLLNSEEMGGLSSININAGNFGMAMNATHYFEMFHFMTDELTQKVSAWFDEASLPNPRGPQFKDQSGCVRLLTPTGKRFYLDASNDQGHGVIVCYNARFGHIIVDELNGEVIINHRAEKEDRLLPTTRYGQPGYKEQKKIMPTDIIYATQSVLETLIQNKHYPDGTCGLNAIKVLVAAYLSNEQQHRMIDLSQDDLPLERAFLWA